MMACVTYLTRMVFLVSSKKLKMPQIVNSSLKYIPVAILSTLVFPGIFSPNGKLYVSYGNPYIIAAIITVIAVLLSKKSIVGIILGSASLIALRHIL